MGFGGVGGRCYRRPMTLEDLADLIRTNSGNTNRRVDELRDVLVERTGALGARIDGVNDRIDGVNERIDSTNERIDAHRNETNAQYMTLHSNIEDIRGAMGIAETVVEMRKRIEALEAEVERLKRSA